MSSPPFDHLLQPESRFSQIPPKANRELSYPIEPGHDFLIYYKNCSPELSHHLSTAVYDTVMRYGSGISDPANSAHLLGYNWSPDPNDPSWSSKRHLWGMGEAASLMNEYTEAIDYIKEGMFAHHDIIFQKLRAAFGDRFLTDKTLGDVMDLVIELAKRRMKVRLREFTSNIKKDQNVFVVSEMVGYLRQVIARTNQEVHRMSLIEDMVWSQCQHIDINEDMFQNTRQLTTAQFEACYGLRLQEAEAIVFYALDQDPVTFKPTELGHFFSWIYQLIDQFVQWRYLALNLWYRKHWKAGKWRQQGGVQLDSIYYQVIAEVFKIVNRIQANEPLTEAVMAPFKRMANLFLAFVDLLQWNIFPKPIWDIALSEKDFDEVKFPATMPAEYSGAARPVLLPGMIITSPPKIPNPRPRLQLHQPILDHMNKLHNVGFPRSWNDERQFSAALGLHKTWNVTPYSKTNAKEGGGGKGMTQGYGIKGASMSAQAVRFADDSLVSEDEDGEGFWLHNVNSGPEPTPYSDLYENVVDSPGLRRKHVAFAAHGARGDTSSPARFSSGHSLKRRASHDVYSASGVKRLRSKA